MSKFTLPSYDNWKTHTSDDDNVQAFPCEHCGEPIMIGEEYIFTDDGNVHDECYDEFAWNKLGASREEAEVCCGEDG